MKLREAIAMSNCNKAYIIGNENVEYDSQGSYSNGQFISFKDAENDVFAPVIQSKTGWANYYCHGLGADVYDTEAQAIAAASGTCCKQVQITFE